MTHGRHLVILPRAKVYITHPSLHVTGFWLYGHKAAVHEALHVTYRVHGRHFTLDVSVFVVEHSHRVRLVEIVEDGIFVAIESFGQPLVDRQPAGDAFYESLYLLVTFNLPWVLPRPVGVKESLHLLHLFAGRLFCIALHACVYGGVNLQPVGIEIVAIVAAPVLQILCQSFAEVGGLAIVGRLHAVVQCDVLGRKGVEGRSVYVSVVQHIGQHRVASLSAVVWV